jgi:nucleotide-binding universal stress UspA family protein
MLSFRRILFPVDLSDQSRRAAPFVSAMVERFHSDLILIHVMQIPAAMYAPPEAGTWAVLSNEQRMRESVEQNFNTFLRDEFSQFSVERVFLEGDPATEIAEYARTEQIGLIMMPTHGYGPFRRFLLGSVTAKVLHDLECPVWTGVHSGELVSHDPKRLRRIVCAVSEGEPAVHVIQWTAEFAKQVGADVCLVHAVQGVKEKYDESERYYREAAFQAAHDAVRALQSEAGTAFEVAVRAGLPAHAVHDEAQDQSADLIIIGRSTHKLGRLRSDEYGIVREAPCPVISV